MKNKTLLMEVIEQEKRVSITVYFHRARKRGLTYSQIAEELGISPSTAAKWAQLMGYDPRHVQQLAWEHNLIPEAVLDKARRRQGRGQFRVVS